MTRQVTEPAVTRAGAGRGRVRAVLPGARASLLVGLSLVCLGSATAAPWDALLGAWPERPGPVSPSASGQWEAGLSGVNRHIDFSDPEDDPQVAARNARGSYQGAHLSAGWAPAAAWWLSGTLAHRELDDGVDPYRYLGWQMAAQWRWHEPEPGSHWPAMALRVAGWGHRAGQAATTTPVRVPGAVLDSVTIQAPTDRSVQFDAIASWALQPRLELGAFASVGETRLAYGGLRATTRRNGCRYDLEFTGNDIFGTLSEPCAAPGGVIEQFFDSSGSYGVDVPAEIAWHGRFVQAGVNLRGEAGAWTWAAGLLWHRIRRNGVDAVVSSRGRVPYSQNRQIVLDAAWRFQPGWALFVRADLGQRLFFNELPVTYNSSTAGRFGSRLSLLTAGLRVHF